MVKKYFLIIILNIFLKFLAVGDPQPRKARIVHELICPELENFRIILHSSLFTFLSLMIE